MTGSVVQVSISSGGVPNHAIDEGHVTARGITGDGWRHPRLHGTLKRAILLTTAEGTEELAAQGFPVYYGALGENLTSRGLDRRSLRIGQRFRAGGAVIELTEVRFPCGTLDVYGVAIQAAIFGSRAQGWDPASPFWGLSGFYATVIEPGIVRTGDSIVLVT